MLPQSLLEPMKIATAMLTKATRIPNLLQLHHVPLYAYLQLYHSITNLQHFIYCNYYCIYLHQLAHTLFYICKGISVK